MGDDIKWDNTIVEKRAWQAEVRRNNASLSFGIFALQRVEKIWCQVFIQEPNLYLKRETILHIFLCYLGCEIQIWITKILWEEMTFNNETQDSRVSLWSKLLAAGKVSHLTLRLCIKVDSNIVLFVCLSMSRVLQWQKSLSVGRWQTKSSRRPNIVFQWPSSELLTPQMVMVTPSVWSSSASQVQEST